MIFTICPAKSLYDIEKEIQTGRPEGKGWVARTPISSLILTWLRDPKIYIQINLI